MKQPPKPDLVQLSRTIRADLIRMTTAAGAGHLTSSLSAVELMVGLMFGGVFRANLKKPHFPNNDRLIFSKGHASPLLYALYAAAGVIPRAELLKYRKFGSRLEGHPMMRFPYTEVPTGSLGQGLSVALGEAMAAQMDRLPYRVYCLLGDSEMSEGSVWEAIQLAGFYQTSNLVAIVDVNGLGQVGPTMFGHNALAIAKRVQAFGWRTAVINGHDISEIAHAYHLAATAKQPFMMVAKTVKGKGVAQAEGKNGWHAKVLSKADATVALRALGQFDPKLRGVVPAPTKKTVHRPARRAVREPVYKPGALVAPRTAIANGLIRLQRSFPELVVLDGELKNSTYTDRFAEKFPRRFIQGYIAEQNMVGMAGGLAARGWLPVAATFGAFFTRAYDQLRLASYASSHQVYVGTHAGVHIGTDGASQMALQDIAMFRTLEKSIVLYPSDAVSAERLLERALRSDGLVYIRTTRAELPVLYGHKTRFPIGGSQTLRRSADDRVTIVAAGVTLHQALQAADQLQKKKIAARVIDAYSVKPIDAQTLKKAARETKHLLVVEDHYPEGGLGEAVRAALGKDAGAVTSLAVRKTPRSGQPEELLAYEGIDVTAIVRAIQRL